MTTQIVTTPSNVPAPFLDNPWADFAAEDGNDLGKLLKFVKGTWKTGEEIIPIGTEFIALVDQVAHGMVSFKEGKIVDQRVGLVADRFQVPTHESLPDTDSNKWEKDSAGNLRDPWVYQVYLPLVTNTGELLTYVTASKGGRSAIRKLSKAYSRKYRDHKSPIIALRVSGYNHDNFGRVETPELVIVGWDRCGSADEPNPKEEIPF